MLNFLAGVNLNVVFLTAGGVLALLLLPKPVEVLLKIGMQATLGLLALFGLNYLLLPLGYGVGLNLITFGVAGVLGLPGVVSLFVLQAFIL